MGGGISRAGDDTDSRNSGKDRKAVFVNARDTKLAFDWKEVASSGGGGSVLGAGMQGVAGKGHDNVCHCDDGKEVILADNLGGPRPVGHWKGSVLPEGEIQVDKVR